jgi:VWFA-related protein
MLPVLGSVALLSVVTFGSPPQQVQEPPLPAASPAAQTSQPEFKLRVQRNMVMVRVIVRDANGRPVPNLRKEDFRLFDNGKAQEIDQFSEESSRGAPATAVAAPGKPSEEKPTSESAPPSAPLAPQNYQALYFDDLQSEFFDLNRARDAAEKYLAATLAPADRVGVFTASGHVILDFTADREQLHAALSKLRPRPLFQDSCSCFDISPSEALLLLNNYRALTILEDRVRQCGESKMAGKIADEALKRLVRDVGITSDTVLRGLDQAVRRTAQLPGQRSVIMLSPGMISTALPPKPLYGFSLLPNRVYDIAEGALGRSVVINVIDVRGLYAIIPGGDASVGSAPTGPLAGLEGALEVSAYARADDTFYDFASITGGQVLNNDNDLEKGLRRVGTLADVYYVLAFSPRNLKPDGHYHQLKVSLVNPVRLTVQARHGYFAPKGEVSPEELAKNEIREAVYSSYPLQDLPLTFETEVRKAEGQNVEVAVQAVLDIRNLPFQKQGDLNLDNVTFAVGLFDHDGKYVTGSQQTYSLSLKDSTRVEMEKRGLALKTHVSAKVGAYTLRVVVRDSQGGKMAAASKAVDTSP